MKLSSVLVKMDDRDQYEELKANGVYKLSLSNLTNLTVYEWRKVDQVDVNTQCESNYLPNINLTVSDVHLKDTIRPFNPTVTDFVQDDQSLDCIADKLYLALKQSVLRRVKNIPNYCKSCSHRFKHAVKFNANQDGQQITCTHAKVGILFSGGVDSAVIAALADECLPPGEPIDLMNIAFEMQKSDPTSKYLVPDRISGIECLKELNPNRKWNFVEINITLDELRRERESLIRHLLYPHQTVLDDSIGCALWFASRGRGECANEQTGQRSAYQSNAEVLLLGMGADEQLGGYARHRTRYEKSGMESLCDEMKMEMDRISQRNLGRDDRIISDHGKESRLPFLDEDLISFLNELEVRQKCNMTLARGVGEKYLLRYLARTRLGLNYASRLQKRAIQFGSRVAKIENVKEKASDICDRIAANLNISNFGEE